MRNPSDSEWRRSRNIESEGLDQLMESTFLGPQAEVPGKNQQGQFQEDSRKNAVLTFGFG